jgi:arsenate reductase-like glutaredoxin family protein
MECNELKLSLYLDKELPSDQMTELTDHLIDCPKCQQILKEWQGNDESIRNILNTVRANQTSKAQLIKQIINNLHPRDGSKFQLFRWAPLAAAAVIIIAIVGYLLLPKSFQIPQQPSNQQATRIEENRLTDKNQTIVSPWSQYSVKPADKEEWIKGVAGYQIKKDDTIKTGSSQSAEITFPNKTVVKLMDNTELVLKGKEECKDNIIYEVINLKGGEIDVKVDNALTIGSLPLTSLIKVETPCGAIINRGTHFTISVIKKDDDDKEDMLRISEVLSKKIAQMENELASTKKKLANTKEELTSVQKQLTEAQESLVSKVVESPLTEQPVTEESFKVQELGNILAKTGKEIASTKESILATVISSPFSPFRKLIKTIPSNPLK